MNDFFVGKNVKLLTGEVETKGVRIWHMKLEESEMKHMTARLGEAVTFLYAAKGSLVCQVNQESEEIREGESLFLNRGNVYRFRECERGGAELYLLVLEKEYMRGDEAIVQKYIDPIWNHETLFSLKFLRGESLCGILKALGETAQKKEEGYELELLSLIFGLWRNLFTKAKKYTVSVKKSEIREKVKLYKMLEYIHANYKDKITLGGLAENAGISTGEYCRFFKKKMERTPFEYLQAFRIEQSLPEILERADTISNIALRHGFTGASYFTETFRKEMGCAPGDYRKWYLDETKDCPLKGVQEVIKPAPVEEQKVFVRRRESMPAHLL